VRGAVWTSWLAAGSLAVATYLTLPLTAQTVVAALLGVGAVVAVLVGIRLHRPERPGAWYAVAGSMAFMVAGDMAFATYDLRGLEAPFPSFADVIYLAGYPFVLLAVAIMLRRSGVPDAAAWQDAGILVVGITLLSWEWLLEPNAMTEGTSLAARAVAVAYPVMDLAVLLLVLRMMVGGVRRIRMLGVLGAAVGCYLVSDVVYGLQALEGTYRTGSWVDLGWLIAPVLIGTCALYPGMASVTRPAEQAPAHRGGWHRAGLFVAVLLAPALLAYQSLWGDHVDGLVIATAAAIMLGLAALRGRGLVRTLERTTSELMLRERELHRQATTDLLTGLANRAQLLDHLDAALDGPDQPVTVALLDLDGFKQVNDSLGHDVGDALLREVAGRLTGVAAPGELVARLGGDEFAVVGTSAAGTLGKRLMLALAAPAVLQGSAVQLGASVGLATSGAASGTVTQLLRHADVAMYVAKSAGGRRVEAYDPQMSVALVQRAALRSQLAQAVERGEFLPYFQPVVDLFSHRLVGFEALARWYRPGGAPVQPDDWIPAAEQAGLVSVVDEQVLRLAAQQMVAWTEAGPGSAALTLAVNVSGHTLQETDVADRILAVLEEQGLARSGSSSR
jgi:diguanylate cyclase (GGDEF)-like protein